MKRRVLVTGASRGIGRAIGERFGRAGCEVVAPPRAELDLAKPEGVRAWIDGHRGLEVDVLVNNAGENKLGRIETIPLEDWRRTIDVNLTAAFQLTQAFAPAMAARGWGRVVNVSSVWSILAKPSRFAYAAAKSGLDALTRTAALELGERGVLVNSICPGFVDTELTRRNNPPDQIAALAAQTALKRLARPEEIAELAWFLGSENNTYLTGQVVVIDGGFSIQ